MATRRRREPHPSEHDLFDLLRVLDTPLRIQKLIPLVQRVSSEYFWPWPKLRPLIIQTDKHTNHQ